MARLFSTTTMLEFWMLLILGNWGCTHSSPTNPPTPVGDGREVVIFLPGILGSTLYDESDTQRWPPASLSAFTFADHLECHPDGSSIKKIHAGEPIKDVYGKIAQELTQSGYDVYRFGYDWRLDNELNVDRLAALIDATGAHQVNLIAHSMGGLLSVNYIKRFGATRVSKLITIGTPYLGAPGAVKSIERGDTVDGILGYFIHDNFTRVYKNNASWYQLFPSQQFFEMVAPSYIQTVKAGSTAAPTPLQGITATRQFLLTRPWANKALLAQAETFTTTNDLPATLKTVDSYVIIGYGFPTIENLTFKLSSKAGDDELAGLDVTWSKNGDGGVLIKSANIGGNSTIIHPGHTYYIEEAHVRLPGNEHVIQQVKGILSGDAKVAAGMHSEPKFYPQRESVSG